ncbi:MAG TPA: MFS transporter [Candidatus Melainabacteria bacterium]|nr:MFS transporter [Candidatus Melainabacteria bacterium]HIN65968.1 MFS transporter [Candidatus Obscuribacterales bacterium]
MTTESETQSSQAATSAPELTSHKVPPSVFIPTLYFMEGLPYTIVNMMSVVFYKNLGASNEFIGAVTSVLSFAWTLKFIWAPLIDIYGTRRGWIVVAQLVLSAMCALLAGSAFLPQNVALSVGALGLIALASATQDVAIDGYYMDVLNKQQQAVYVGVRNAIYKIAVLVGQGPLVMLAGFVAASSGTVNYSFGWATAFSSCCVLFLCFGILHLFILPKVGDSEKAQSETKEKVDFLEGMKRFGSVLKTFIDQDRIAVICLYIFIFRFGDALMLKMTMPFLLDAKENGGLALSTQDVGLIYGTVGPIFLLVGGLLGGYLVAKFTLKKVLMPTALIQSIAIPLYWALAYFKPEDFSWIYIANSFEQFSYGLGTAAYTVFLLSVVKPQYKAAHYAIATAIMALGLIVPGYISGYMTTWLGYPNFFLVSFLASIPGIITIFFLPIKSGEEKLSS